MYILQLYTYIYIYMSKDRVQVAYRIISVPLHRLQALSLHTVVSETKGRYNFSSTLHGSGAVIPTG